MVFPGRPAGSATRSGGCADLRMSHVVRVLITLGYTADPGSPPCKESAKHRVSTHLIIKERLAIWVVTDARFRVLHEKRGHCQPGECRRHDSTRVLSGSPPDAHHPGRKGYDPMDWRIEEVRIRADAFATPHGVGLHLRAYRGGRPASGLVVEVCGPRGGEATTDASGCVELPSCPVAPGVTALRVRVRVGARASTQRVAILPAPAAAHAQGAPRPAGEGGAGAAGGPQAPALPLSAEDEHLRRLVAQHRGDTARAAGALGVSRPTLSRRLNGPVHAAWWRAFKASRGRERRRAQQRRARCRRYFRALLSSPGQYVGFQGELRARLTALATRRGATLPELLGQVARAWRDDPALASPQELLGASWGRHDANRVADGVCALADLLALPRGPAALYRTRARSLR